MLLDRHRVARLIELTAMESTLQGPERLLREEDVKLFLKAAYDDATDEARAAFMTRVEAMPSSAWPWSAVKVTQGGGGGGGVVVGGGGGGIGGVGKIIVAVPKPVVATTPAALVLLRGQADFADADPGDRLPARGTLEGAPWEPLFQALDDWDTSTIQAWIGPQGWGMPSGVLVPNDGEDADPEPVDDAATSGAPADGVAGDGPADADSSGDEGSDTDGGGRAPTGTGTGSDVPAPQPAESETSFNWRHPAVVATGTAVAVIAGAIVVYRAGQRRSRRQLSERIAREGGLP